MSSNAPPGGAQRRERRLTKSLAVTVIVVAAFLRLPGVVEPLGIDQGIFATAGWSLERGLTPYVDLWDQKPPGIHLTYMAAFAVFGHTVSAVFWLDLLATFLTGALLWALGRVTGGARLAWLAACVWAVGSIPSIRYSLGGFLERAVAETFISPLALGAVLATWRSGERMRVAGWSAAGTLIGVATVFKPTALVYLPALAVGQWMAFGRLAWRELAAGAAGTALAPGVTVAWLAASGALEEAWTAVVEYNRAYLTAGPGLLEFGDRFAHELWRRTKTDPLWALGAAAGLVAVWRLRARNRVDPLPTICLVWLAAAVAAAAANGFRMFNAYFIPCLPPLAMLGAWALAQGWSGTSHGGRVALWATLCATAVTVRVSAADRVWTATSADLNALRHPALRQTYLERFGGYANGRGYSARANAELIEYLRDHSSSTDRVFIFGMAPGVYFEAQRLPGQRFLFVGPAVSRMLDRPGYTLEGLAAELAVRRPAFIIRENNNRDSTLGWTVQSEFARPAIQRVLQGYREVAVIEDFTVFRRLR